MLSLVRLARLQPMKLYQQPWREACADALRNKLVKWFFRRQWLKGNGPKFWVLPGDAVCREILTYGQFDKVLLRTLAPLLQPLQHGVVLDVGANIGNHTLFFAGVFKQVVAFEPNPAVFTILQANVQLNQTSNVTLVPKGLGNKAATLPFYRNIANNLGAGGFVNTKAEAALGTLEVQPGDAALSGLKIAGSAITAIKLDVEGFELEALQGLDATLAHHPLIMMELLNAALGTPVIEHLKAKGYAHFYEVSERQGFMGRVGSVKALHTVADRYHALVLATHQPLPVAGLE